MSQETLFLGVYKHYPRSLIRAFVIPLLEILKYHILTCYKQNFNLAEQAGLNLTLSEIPKTGLGVVAHI